MARAIPFRHLTASLAAPRRRSIEPVEVNETPEEKAQTAAALAEEVRNEAAEKASRGKMAAAAAVAKEKRDAAEKRIAEKERNLSEGAGCFTVCMC